MHASALLQVNVEHFLAADMPEPTGSAGKRALPLSDGTDRLVEDILNAGSKKSRMDESEQDRRIRLFHAVRGYMQSDP